MSHFIANAIQFNHDLTEVKLKGSDNNVYPKTNEWSHFYPIAGLMDDYTSGSVKLTGYNEKISLVEYALNNSFSHSEFSNNLHKLFTNYVPSAKNYIVCDMFKYVKKNTKNYLEVSRDIERAKTYSKFAAIKIAKRSDNFEPMKVSDLPEVLKNIVLNNPINK